MNKWIAEFDLEEGDTMPEHMDLNYMGAHIDFHCRPMWIPISERLPKVDEEASRTVQGRNGWRRMNSEIKSVPFSWNDNFSEEALEDFQLIQKGLSYATCQSIGMALAKLEILEKQGCKVNEEKIEENERS